MPARTPALRVSLRSEMKRAAYPGRHMARLHGANPFRCPLRRRRCCSRTQLHHVIRRGTLLSLDDVELHALTFGERLVSVALDRGMMDETILFTALACNETEPLAV